MQRFSGRGDSSQDCQPCPSSGRAGVGQTQGDWKQGRAHGTVAARRSSPLGGDVVDGQPQGGPEGDDDGEDTEPNGDDGDDDEGGRGDGSHNVGPHARDEHHLHEEGESGLVQRAVLLAEHDLEVTLQQRRNASHTLLHSDTTCQGRQCFLRLDKHINLLQSQGSVSGRKALN